MERYARIIVYTINFNISRPVASFDLLGDALDYAEERFLLLDPNVIDLGGEGARFWRVTSGANTPDDDAHNAAVHARATGSMGGTYNDAIVERIKPTYAEFKIIDVENLDMGDMTDHARNSRNALRRSA